MYPFWLMTILCKQSNFSLYSKTECGGNEKCSVCGFEQIQLEFINNQDAEEWFLKVVQPYREKYAKYINSDNDEFCIENLALRKYKGNANYVKIPEGVTAIGKEAFWNCSSIVNIVLPDSVELIEDAAFGCCRNLESISIPGKITAINAQTFFGCSSLVEITIPNNVVSIGKQSFAECTSLITVNLPKSLRIINEDAFELCEKLHSVMFPIGVERIEDGAFAFDSINTIIIPTTVTSIGKEAFRGNPLFSALVPESTENIGKKAFDSKCELMIYTTQNSFAKKYAIQNNIATGDLEDYCDAIYYNTEEFAINKAELKKYIGKQATINIPKGVRKIGNDAFRFNSNIEKVIIPNSVEEICDRAFEYCRKLQAVYIPPSVSTIGNFAFYRSNVAIMVMRNSYAEKYAKENGITCHYI